jgi:sugar lactone lactonase YvrE
MSHFQSYKLTWSPANGTGGDSSFGILPESLFFSPALPPEPDPTGAGQETPRLAWWNTRPIIDQYGVGFYCLTLTVLDSAGNQSVAQTVVYLDTSSKDATGAGDAGSGALSLATTPENDLLVGTTTGTITQYTSELDSVQSMTIQDSTGPAVITGLATDPSGAIYLGDTRDRNVKVCDEQGNPTDTIGSHTQLTTPNSVAIARNGDVYVADRSRNVIRVYGQDNTLKLSFGEPGSDTGQFLGAYALALSYTTALDFQVSLDSSGSPRMETTSTTLTRCLIADKGNHRIQVFDHAGRYLASFGDSVLSQPVGLSVDTSNCRYVADQGNKAIYGFDPNGTLFLTITAADTMTPIATTISSDNGSLYTIDQNTHQLLKYLVSYTDTAEMGGGQSGAIKPIPAPRELILEQSRPNPANQSLTIRYGIPRLTNISLKVYDISGRLVRTLKNDDQHKPGYYNITWNCKDNRDRAIPNGIYFYRLTSDDKLQSSSHKSQTRVKTRKLVIAR